MSHLSSFAKPLDALVVGANGGIGRAFIEALTMDDSVRTVHAWSRHPLAVDHSKLIPRILDIADEAQLQSAVEKIERLTLVIVATGILHRADGLSPEKSYKALNSAHMMESLHINVILPALVAKYTLPRLPRNERTVFCALSARVGSISDNRLGGWYSYRAGKAALNQIIKCLSIEMRRTHPDAVCIGLHPGTVDTGLSEPFQKSLAPDHALFTTAQSAGHLLQVIDQASPEESGSLFAWDGKIIPA